MLEAGEITESVISVDDLRRATRLWLINSVHGARPPNWRRVDQAAESVQDDQSVLAMTRLASSNGTSRWQS